MQTPLTNQVYEAFISYRHVALDAAVARRIHTMIENFKGGPVGVDTIAAATGEERTTIEDVYEPFLMQIGFLAKTPRGRVLTPSAWQHLGLDYPNDRDNQLTLDNIT